MNSSSLRPRPSSVVTSFLNQIGKVGKTTLSVNVASVLARKDFKVFLIDAGPQGSSLDWWSSLQDDHLFNVVALPRPTIHKEIGILGSGFDHVVIDGPPRVCDLARSAIMSSDAVLIPVQAFTL